MKSFTNWTLCAALPLCALLPVRGLAAQEVAEQTPQPTASQTDAAIMLAEACRLI